MIWINNLAAIVRDTHAWCLWIWLTHCFFLWEEDGVRRSVNLVYFMTETNIQKLSSIGSGSLRNVFSTLWVLLFSQSILQRFNCLPPSMALDISFVSPVLSAWEMHVNGLHILLNITNTTCLFNFISGTSGDFRIKWLGHWDKAMFLCYVLTFPIF